MTPKGPLLFVPTRGEIATRILSTARELSLRTLTVHTASDTSHTHSSHSSLPVPSASSFTDAALIHSLAVSNNATHLHPGYGFLSESPELAELCEASGIVFIGPSSSVLRSTGNKTSARQLAIDAAVPVLPAVSVPDVASAVEAARKVGFPVMLKAVNGGGGRGIRIIQTPEELDSAWKRTLGEAGPGADLFIEKAAPAEARHVEVQIIGDGKGGVKVLGTRDCSIQRRFQKVVEIAPAGLQVGLEGRVCGHAENMAKRLRYKGLGTWEFLVDKKAGEVWFLEINPRVQVEHTITETLLGIDIIALQLSIFLSPTATLPSTLPAIPPNSAAIQIRLTATSTGTVTSFSLPTGNGIRVDTHLRHHPPTQITSDFDPLLAKLIIHAPTFPLAVAKARRALEDTSITGVSTDLDLLRSIIHHPDFLSRSTGIRWLESSTPLPPAPTVSLFTPPAASLPPPTASTGGSAGSGISLGPPLLKKNDSWAVTLTPPSAEPISTSLTLTRVLANDFPLSFSADITYNSLPFKLQLKKGGAATGGKVRRKGSGKDEREVVVPFGGEVVEVGEGVKVGGRVQKGEVVVVVRVMKTELEVRANRGGRVSWAWDVKAGEGVDGGEVVCVIEEDEGEGRPKL